MHPTYLQSLWVSREEIIELSDTRAVDILDNFASRTVARAKRTQDDGSKRVARKWESRGGARSESITSRGGSGLDPSMTDTASNYIILRKYSQTYFHS